MPIVIRGVDKLVKKLGAAAAVQTLYKPMQRSLSRLQRFMQEYPPPPPLSTYRRTGTYGRRWTIRTERSGSGLAGRVGNNVVYSPYVGSDRFQTRTHRATGWETDEQAVAKNEDAILADFTEAMDRALAS